ncbi:MAG: DUF4416 family protein [Candidatus Brocadiaceae bacterium]|nr:DUF4416 family protein [Candidatus Brocadiaceae bacterium]
MGKVHPPTQVNLIIGMLSNVTGLFETAGNRLEEKFGPIELRSPILPFNYTDYYEKEIGRDIKRQFLSFQKLIDPGALADIKLFTNKLEESCRDKALALSKEAGPGRLLDARSASGGYRPINIDPGYLASSKLVLASTKDYSHRIYLKKGIYAEVTLRYAKGAFEPLPWTYPDYRSKEYIDFFTETRTLYMKKLRGQSASGGNTEEIP